MDVRVAARELFALAARGPVALAGTAVTSVALGDGLVRVALADGAVRALLPWALVDATA